MKTEPFYNLYSKFADKTLVNAAQIDCTYRCNLDCRHCCQSKNTSGELAAGDIKRILLELKQNNCLEINFSGGEPLLRKDFPEIIRFASDLDFRVRILTNGTLIDKAYAQKLSKINIYFVQISLYGIKKETHDFTTRAKGSFERTLQAITLLDNYGIRFRIAFLVMKHNFFEAQIFKKIAKKKKWSVTFEHVVMPTADRGLFPLQYRITDEQASLALEDIKVRRQFISKAPRKRNGIFRAGEFIAYIAPDGEVYPNCSLRLPCGNLKSRSFADVWQNSKTLNRLRDFKIEDSQCSSCEFLSRCLSSPAWGLLKEKELTGPFNEACRFTRLAIAKEEEFKKRRFEYEKGK